MNATLSAAATGNAAAAAPLRQHIGLVIAWFAFWLLMTTIAVQDHLRSGGSQLWQPLLWEGSSCVVTSVIAWWNWSRAPRLDALLHRPWAWLGRALRWLPLHAVLFVAAVYALRHAVYAALGQAYHHEPWPALFVYETLKFSMFFVLFAAAGFGVRSHGALLAERLRAERSLALAQRAQLLQLAQQLQPHFLFNALNTIAAVVHEDADRADALLTKLAALLRASSDLARRATTTLDEELRLLEGYTAIMQERFADRVSVRLDIDDAARRCEVPALLLQPLVENCFRHGVEKRTGAACIVVAARCAAGRLELQVADDIGELDATAGEGTGLTTLRQRLAAAYGDAAALQLARRAGGRGVVASVVLPCAC